MRLKTLIAVSATIGAVAVGSASLPQSAVAAENVDTGSLTSRSNDPWKYYGEFTRDSECHSFGQWRVAAHAWKQYRCTPAGDSWDLSYIPETPLR